MLHRQPSHRPYRVAAGKRNLGNMRAMLVGGVLMFMLAACTASGFSSRSDEFTLPVLSLGELQNLLHASLHEVEGSTPPVSFAAVICGAKGYRRDGANFADCAAHATRAAQNQPDALEHARSLAKMVDRLVEMDNNPAMRVPETPGAPFVCYDFTLATVSTCQDI